MRPACLRVGVPFRYDLQGKHHVLRCPFLVAITLLTMSPGVDALLVIRNTARGGLGDGVLTSLAICCGLFVHAVVSALGISFLLLQSACFLPPGGARVSGLSQSFARRERV